MLKKVRTSLSVLVTLVFTLSVSVGSFAQGNQPFTATAVTPQSVLSTEASKGSANSDARISIIVKLEDASLAAYSGSVAGLAPTNPRITGTPRLDVRSSASQAYLAYLNGKHNAFMTAALQAVPSAQIIHNYTVVFGGVSMVVPSSALATISRMAGVKAIYHDVLQQPDTERSPQFIGAPNLWNQLGGPDDAGEGAIVGVIDTGIWPEHASFSDPDPRGETYAAPPVTWTGTTCDFGNTAWNLDDAPFTCNNKLIGASTFLDTYRAVSGLLAEEFDSARDSEGHGTHTASTAAGNHDVRVTLLGVNQGRASGIAPRAHVAMYRACADAGCYFSDLTAAIDQAVADGVDVINYSISGGGDPYAETASLAFLDAYNAGVFVAASAGNSGPGAETVAHREPWVTTVGASTSDRHFLSTATVSADNGDSLELGGASVTDGLSTPTSIVYAGDFGDPLCLDATADGAFAGMVVLCDRGTIARVAKSYNVGQRGAVGMILRNLVLQGLATDNHFIPSVHLEFDTGASLLDFMTTHTGVLVSFTAGTATQVQGDVMAAFSSRGGPGQTLGISKPDVTAPGVQILAGHTPLPHSIDGGSPGELFQAIQGTSMSSPHVAGAGALLAALHPDWTPGQIKSALMTTARTAGVTKEDGVTPADAFDDGSGRINLRVAGNPGLTFDVAGQDYLDHEADLFNTNYPSIYVPDMPGRVTVQRTAHSVVGANSAWNLLVSAPSDMSVTVPATLLVPAGGDATFDITIDASAVPVGEVRMATIYLRRGQIILHIPVTIVRGEADVTLSKTCDPATFAVGATTSCTLTLENTSQSLATVSLVDTLPAQLSLVSGTVVGGLESGNGLTFDGALAGAAAPVIDVIDGVGTTFGYLPLSLFGIDPIAGVGDETIINLDVSLDGYSIEYAGVSYTTIDMTSNGYAVVGGTGDLADLDFINQSLPDATQPNNVLAPFWTDLDPGAGGALRAAYLTDGVNDWLILDWEDVPNFSDGELNDFQLWIGVNSPEDIFFNYGDVSDGDFGALTVGAENDSGTSGENWWYNGVGTPVVAGSEVRVTSVPGAPGEMHVITFDATGASVGSWTNCAEMTGDIFFGTSIACFSGEVTSP